MEGIILTLLILVTIAVISMMLLLLRRARVTRNNLKALTDRIMKMAESQPEHQYQIPPKGNVEELTKALKLLLARLQALADDLSGEMEKVTAILSTIGAGVLILNKERRVTTLNMSAVKLFKVPSDAAVGRPFINLIRDHEMDAIVQKCLETNQNQTGVVQVVGNKQYLEITATPLSNSALVLVQDLTNCM